MKLQNVFYWGLLMFFLASCSDGGLFQKNSITYAEALEMESIQFIIDGREIEDKNALGFSALEPLMTHIILRSPAPFSCEELAQDCEDDKVMYTQSFWINIDDGSDESIFLQIEPGIMIDSGLVDYLFKTSPIFLPIPQRPFFKDPSNIKKYYAKKGDWIEKKTRNVKFLLSIGDRFANFSGSTILESKDQFEITEIKKIEDQDHTFLVSGIFQALIPDGRDWLPLNEQKDPVQITDGKFSFIVESVKNKE